MQAALPHLTRAERASIQRRLDRWELAHLRELAASLDERLEAETAGAELLRRELAAAQDCAESWWRDFHALQADLEERGGHLALCKTGALHAVLPSPVHRAAELGARVLL